ncbi:MAG: lactate racemase domain-containing protein [Chloroflexota bacterium]|jgi:nickel-dependent lactate racemase|nr:lactate racemase domain-containing protein [Chloroflexota bacterium]MDP6509174.1 lactate racemase domain-containing protein [Chloroflexota bacterium]MDP6756984.1 lactate racemase domain-containing protein [Chloroflexota bacterium]
MAKVELPIRDAMETVEFPDSWQVHWAPIADVPALTPDQMRAALAAPIGTERLSTLAKGKGDVVILVDDNTRPTPAWEFLPYVIEELHAGGVEDAHIKIMAGLALHRPLTVAEFRRKVGQELVDRYNCVNPSPWEQLVDLGETVAGVPVKMNMEYVEADLRVSCGGIIPHPDAGFGGGAKLTMPGVCSYETIFDHHETGRFSHASGRGTVEGNSFRAEIEQIAAKCPPEFLVNPVLNREMRVAGLFCGDYIQAHRAGVEVGKKLYKVDSANDADLAVICGAPQDSEFMQGMKALANGFGPIHSVRPDGAVLMTGDGEEGYGYHHLAEHARRTKGPERLARPDHYCDRELICYSPNVSPAEFKDRAPDGSSLFRGLAEAVEVLASRTQNAEPVVNVFPQGPISMYLPG